jgi:uncharacterized CHY-type Zn-finger protein
MNLHKIPSSEKERSFEKSCDFKRLSKDSRKERIAVKKDITIYTCDRCHKELDVSPLKAASWIKPTFIFMKAKMQIWGSERYKENGQKEYDLCQECSDEFLEWFDMK